MIEGRKSISIHVDIGQSYRIEQDLYDLAP